MSAAKRARTDSAAAAADASGRNVDADTGLLYTNFDQPAGDEGHVDTSGYKASGRMKGRVAVVTGGGQAIGRTIVEVLAKEGAAVHFCARRPDGASVADALTGGGHEAYFRQVDVTDEQALKGWLDSVGERHGRIDVVVPNAVNFVFGKIDDVTSADWDAILSVNVKGYANTIKYALPHIRKTGRGGAVVNIASISSFIAQPAFVPYNTTKGAILQMTRCMAMDLGPERIRVNAVCPGVIDTPATSKHAKNLGIPKSELAAECVKSHFLKRLGSTLDCAYAVLFLASEESSFITGTSLLVDGGLTAA